MKPVAALEPVDVGGVTVARATLHNPDYILSRDIRVGDLVVVKRAGDVIPAVVGPVVESRTADLPAYTPPTVCPECGRPLVRPEGTADLRHAAGGCPASLRRAVQHFASRSAMDIDGMGEKIAAQLVDTGLVADLPDLFSLTESQLLALDGFKERKAERLLSGLDAATTRPLARLLFGLGIRHVGETVARLLVAHYDSLDALASAEGEALEAIDGVGPVVAESVSVWFADETNRAMIEGFRAARVNLVRLPSEPVAIAGGRRRRRQREGVRPHRDAADAHAARSQSPHRGGRRTRLRKRLQKNRLPRRGRERRAEARRRRGARCSGSDRG